MTKGLIRARVVGCLWIAAVATAHLCAASDVDPNASARDMATLGVTLFENGDYEGARDLFHRAFQVIPAPTLSIREARALAKLGRLTESAELYTRTASWPLDASSPEAYRDAVSEAAAELPGLRTRQPKLRILARTGTTLEVRVDGRPVDHALFGSMMPLDPGTHRIEVLRSSVSIASQTLTLADADVRTVELEASDDGPHIQVISRDETSHPWRTTGLVSLGIGAAGLAVGITTGLLAAGKKSSLDDACPTHVCPPSSAGDVDTLHSLRVASTASYVVGFLGLGAGAALLLTVPDRYRSSSVTAFVGPTQAGVSGTF